MLKGYNQLNYKLTIDIINLHTFKVVIKIKALKKIVS